MYTNRWKILHIVNLGTFITTLDLGILNVALPTIAEQFSTAFGQIQWVFTCYLLTLVALLPLMGKLSDQIGRDKIYSAGFLVFGLGSLLAVFSTSLWVMIVARCIQGIGATMIMANSQAMVRQIFPDNERGKALGLNAVIISIGTLTGPSAGGILLAFMGWEGLFLINIPLCIIGFWGGMLLFPKVKLVVVRNLDFVGILVLSCAAILLVLAAEGSGDGFSGMTWMLTIGGLVLFAGLIVYETRIDSGILDKELFTNRTIVIGNASAFLIHLVQMAALIPITFYLQRDLGFDPWITGLILGLQPLMMGIVAPLSGWYRDRYGAFSPLLVGPFIGAMGMAAIALTKEVTLLPIVLHLVLFGFNMGCFQATNNAEIMTAAPEHKVSHTGSMLALIRYLGMIAGIGLATILVGHLGDGGGVAFIDFRMHVLFWICFVCCLGVSGLILFNKFVSTIASDEG